MHSVPTAAPVPHRSVLSLSGSQASEFLNGILASSVNQTGPHRPMFSTFLHAQVSNFYHIEPVIVDPHECRAEFSMMSSFIHTPPPKASQPI